MRGLITPPPVINATLVISQRFLDFHEFQIKLLGRTLISFVGSSDGCVAMNPYRVVIVFAINLHSSNYFLS